MKILLVRKINANADLLDKAGMTGFLKGQPLKVSPIAWEPEHGISHYGYVLDGMKLDDLVKLSDFVGTNEGMSLIGVRKDQETIEDSLRSCGLRENPIA